MNSLFPYDAKDIHVRWTTEFGAFGVISFTDDRCFPYIGFYRQNLDGKDTADVCYFQRSRMMTKFVIGFRKKTPIVAYIDVEVTTRGLTSRVSPPISVELDSEPSQSARWNDKTALYSSNTNN